MNIAGRVNVCIEHRDNERFLNLMRRRDIKIYDVRYEDNKVVFCINANEYKELKEVFRKTGIVPKIYKKSGLIFRVKRWLRFKSVILGILVFLIIIYLSTRVIWNVKLENNYIISKDEMMKVLGDNSIYPGKTKKDINCLEIENIIRGKFDYISFVSARIEGTTLIIKVKENTEEESKKRKFGTKSKFNEPIDYITDKSWNEDVGALVAPCDGNVYSIVTSKGVPKVKKGEEVKKGQILIDGVIEIRDDFGELTSTKEVLAEGEVYILGEFTYKSTIKLGISKKKYIDSRNSYYLRWEDYKLILYKPLNISSNCDIMLNEYSLGLDNDILNKIHIGNYSYMEYNVYDDMYSDSEAKDILAREFNTSIENLRKQEKYLKDFSLTYKKGADTLELSGTIKLMVKANHYTEVVHDNARKGAENSVGN